MGNFKFRVWSVAASDAYQMTWCCIQGLCIDSGWEPLALHQGNIKFRVRTPGFFP
jgi:hypothetical protein